jgi:hypothetical protein
MKFKMKPKEVELAPVTYDGMRIPHTVVFTTRRAWWGYCVGYKIGEFYSKIRGR